MPEEQTMNTIELFSGTASFSKVMAKHGHNTCTVDFDDTFQPTYIADVEEINYYTITAMIGGYPHIIWASPPCQAFSVAAIGKNWTGGKKAYLPKSKSAYLGLRVLDHTIMLISESKPKYWFIENPRGVMRKVIEPMFKKHNIRDWHRVTVWYCQYGDKRAKPTDIWTNLPGWTGRQCKNGRTCHEASPRGSKTGTQGLKGAKERGVIPPALFEELLKYIEQDKK